MSTASQSGNADAGRRSPPDPAAFLRAQQPRAMRLAELACASRGEALGRISVAMGQFALDAQTDAGGWPLRFWQLLDRELRRGRDASGAGGAPAPEQVPVGGPEALRRLLSALRGLPYLQRQAFLLRVWVGFDLDRTAQVLELPLREVKSHLFHALQTLAAEPGTELAGVGESPRASDWVLAARALLDQWAQRLEPALSARLEQARAAAFATSQAPVSMTRPRSHWLGVLAIVAGLAALGGYFLWPAAAPEQSSPVLPAVRGAGVAAPLVGGGEAASPLSHPDFELLADPEDFRLIEHLEFHAWLAGPGLEEP